METSWLGRREYAETLQLQEERVAEVHAHTASEILFLVEHAPVFTIGRQRDQSSLKSPQLLPFPVFETNRGGQATYHGPGQLVGYPILNLTLRGRDLHKYLRDLEEYIIQLSAHFGVKSERREGFTGVWVGNRKLASIGVGVRKWISMHGFGLNVHGDLGGFTSIIPCGIQDVVMTSLSREVGREIPMQDVVEEVIRTFPPAFAISPEKNPA